MQRIYFKFGPGVSVYAPIGKRYGICPISAYIITTIKTFFRKRGINYYRLRDDRVFDEKSLLDVTSYQALLVAENERNRECLEGALSRI